MITYHLDSDIPPYKASCCECPTLSQLHCGKTIPPRNLLSFSSLVKRIEHTNISQIIYLDNNTNISFNTILFLVIRSVN